MKTISQKLASYAAELPFKDLKGKVVLKAKDVVLDTLGCAIGGYNSKASNIAQTVLGKMGGIQESTVIGSGMKIPSPNATLINGIMVRYLDYMDYIAFPLGRLVSASHPSEIIPAALAVGEKVHANGKDVITAIVLGYELMGRFCASVKASPLRQKGWHYSTLGYYVTPLVAGKLLDLNEEQMVNALGISGCYATLGIVDAEGEEFSMKKNMAFPFAAHRGVFAALLAKEGFTGPKTVIEGKSGLVESVMRRQFDLDKFVEREEEFWILRTIHKPFPAVAASLGILTATLKIVEQNKIAAKDIEQIRIWSSTKTVEHTGDLAKRYPTNKETADHSSPYLVAIAILERAIGPEQFTMKQFSDPRVHEIIEKVTLDVDPELDKAELYPAARVEIQTKQGAKYTSTAIYHKGHYENPMTAKELEDKFRSTASGVMSKSRIQEVINVVYNLDRIDDVSQLMQLVVE